MKERKIKISPRVQVHFDPNDPDTPVMVYRVRNGKEVASATFFCAAEVGELSACGFHDDDYHLTGEELDELHIMTDMAETFFNEVRERCGYGD